MQRNTPSPDNTFDPQNNEAVILNPPLEEDPIIPVNLEEHQVEIAEINQLLNSGSPSDSHLMLQDLNSLRGLVPEQLLTVLQNHHKRHLEFVYNVTKDLENLQKIATSQQKEIIELKHKSVADDKTIFDVQQQLSTQHDMNQNLTTLVHKQNLVISELTSNMQQVMKRLERIEETKDNDASIAASENSIVASPTLFGESNKRQRR